MIRWAPRGDLQTMERSGSKSLLGLLGRPGSGKTTVGEAIEDLADVHLIRTGDLLREEVERDSPAGREVADRVNGGGLASTEVVRDLVALQATDVVEPILVLDGYPRTWRWRPWTWWTWSINWRVRSLQRRSRVCRCSAMQLHTANASVHGSAAGDRRRDAGPLAESVHEFAPRWRRGRCCRVPPLPSQSERERLRHALQLRPVLLAYCGQGGTFTEPDPLIELAW